MHLETKFYYELLDIIEQQTEILNKQKELIIRLVNENVEKENMIEVLMQEEYLD